MFLAVDRLVQSPPPPDGTANGSQVRQK